MTAPPEILSISCRGCGAPQILSAHERNLTCYCGHIIRRNDYPQTRSEQEKPK